MFPDPLIALRTLLIADAEVAALAGTRVYVPELPSNQAASMPRNAVVLSESGGPGYTGMARIGQTRIDVRAYGADFVEAWRVHASVHEVLKQLTRSLVGEAVIYTVTVQGGPLRLREAEVDWPLILRSYQVTAAELAAA
jgi:hypothetical protein